MIIDKVAKIIYREKSVFLTNSVEKTSYLYLK